MPDRKPRPPRQTPHRDRICKACGKVFSWRREWDRDWDVMKYCSDGCRGYAPGERDLELEAAILSLLADRGPQKTICPSEAAKLVGGTNSLHNWQSLMEPARQASRRLVAQGRIVITQKGRVVDPGSTRGPIRLRLL